MDLFALLAVYVLLLLSIIFVLLFGENSAFQGTLVARAHELLSGGLCTSAARLCVRCCGPHAQRVLDALSSRCVERPNPALQLMYVSLVTGGYVAFVTSAWQLIPGPYVSEVHLVLGPLATSASLLFFILTCFSDPGVVTAANVERHLACYPFDGLLYSPKRCPTMRLSCPPRSKFCRVTNRRVARFDHYCGWMANDIGENNYRYFVGFLAAHVVLCAYGAWLMCAILAGEVTRSGILDVLVEHRGREVAVRHAPAALVQWVTFTHLPIAMLALFLALTCILVIAFLGYHVHLLLSNETTNEAWKRKDMRMYLIDCALYDAEQTQAAAEGAAGPTAAPKDAASQAPNVWCHRLRRRRRGKAQKPRPATLPPDVLAEIDARCRNVYDRGALSNLLEVLFPRSQRRRLL